MTWNSMFQGQKELYKLYSEVIVEVINRQQHFCIVHFAGKCQNKNIYLF